MGRYGSTAAAWAGLAMIGLYGSPLSAETDAVQAIKDAAIIDVPLVLDAMEPAETASGLWAKGEKPANPLLARFSMKPVEVATMDAAGSGQPKLLWRAVRGGGARLLRTDDLHDADGARYFCGAPAGSGLACFIDQDGDGSFDHVAEAMAERGLQPYHITIIKAEKPLPAPRPYRRLGPDQRPAVSIELRNCAKDYDRPRYTALSMADRAAPMMPAAFAWHEKDSSFASCRRGSRIDAFPGGAVAPAGGYLAQIGPLAFAIGPKNDPRLTLLGPVEAAALYRLEGNSLVPVSIGYTPGQAKLIAMKKFPYPSMMTDAGATLPSGTVKVGERLASVPFHHAYRGKLTQDISVSTLFGSRSVAAGTVVYGFPARSQITTTVNGVPGFQTVGDDEYRKINLQLTWCAPIHSAEPVKEKPNAPGRNGWSAACIPHSMMGNYTILTDLQPAFGVSGVSYDVNTSSNDGMPPIERDDQAAFAQPLRIDYVYGGREGEFISLSEQLYFGDELTSSAPKKLYAPGGKVSVTVAGTGAQLAVADSGDLLVTPAGLVQPGSSALLKWDQNAQILQQLQKLGLRMEPSAAPAMSAGESD